MVGAEADCSQAREGRVRGCWHESQGAFHGTFWKLGESRNKLKAWLVVGCVVSHNKETCLTVFNSVYLNFVGLAKAYREKP